MRLQRHLVVLTCCLSFGLTAFAQTSPPKQQPANDTGIVGDTGEETDQPVGQVAANQNPEDAAWQMLETGLKESKEETRIAALNAIGTLGGIQRAEMILQAAIKDQNVDVRVAAAGAAGSTQDENLIPALRQALDDTAPEVVFAAAVSLWRMHDPSGINILYEVLAGDRKTKGSLMQTGMHEASKDLHDPATLAKIGAQQGAYAVLGPFGIGLDAARLMMKSSNGNSARVLTVNLLSQDHSDATRDEFIAALGDKDYFVRAGSARVLGTFRGKEVSDALAAAFSDSKPSVRFMAAASYIRSTQPAPAGSKSRRKHAKTKPASGE